MRVTYNNYLIVMVSLIAAAFTSLTWADAFVLPTSLATTFRQSIFSLSTSEKSIAASATINDIHDYITINDKLTIRDATPDERGKGGVLVSSEHDANNDGIKALEVLARIPRDLIIASVDMSPRAIEAISNARNITWATELTAVTLASLHPTEDEIIAAASSSNKEYNPSQIKQELIKSWKTGGWGNSDDLGPDISSDCVGTLLATGSDNDKNVFAKFRMPAHPAIFKASMGLGLLTKCAEDDAREALTARGFTYRSMRDALEPLVLTSTERASKGTVRDKRCWDVADTLDRVLSRATTLQLENNDGSTTDTCAVVPIHERLSHSLNENSKLVSIGDEILLVATRDLEAGEQITRDYTATPRLLNDESTKGSALHLLLQFGLPPSSWPGSSEEIG